MKLSRIIIASALVISLGIAGCGVTNQTPSAIKTGVTKMLSITADLKTAIDAGDEAKVKATGSQLEDAWSPFEDNAKQKYPVVVGFQ